ncbi:MAG: hypothetical protein NTAFB05_26870 [Nitrobacter sp.]|uniref:hypothetical protein n=1 Tax=Nitrobacter sp. TaxID=29420 RepID=UPI00387DEABF
MCAQRRRARKGRPRQPVPKTLPDNLYDYADDPTQAVSRPRYHHARARDRQTHASDVETMRVVDDWPEYVPITEAEILVFERWFADVFEELPSPIKPQEGLPILSQTDKHKP